jgi:hypothetical protein
MEPRRGRWLILLQAERDRRAAAKTETADGDAAWKQFIDTLQEMAGRLAAATPRFPLDVGDMSVAEMLAARWFLPEHLQPPGLPTETEIWTTYEARSAR